MGPYLRCSNVGCFHNSTEWLDRVPLCGEHYAQVRAKLRAEVVAELGLARVDASVVYYMCWRHRDEIKIGTSQNIEKRLKSLSNGPKGRATLMATEPGGYAVERKRHRQFRSLRISGTELFRWAPMLADHVEALRQQAR